MSSFTPLTACLSCGNTELMPLLNLGSQPLANSYHDGSQTLEEFPLAIHLCPVCFHSQQSVAVEPDLMFKKYPYVSGTSQTLREYFAWFADFVDGYLPLPGTKKVLDIACNDGSQLVQFKKLGWDAYGIDPAENLIETARATGARVLLGYWGPEAAADLGGTFDAIVAQNVFAHTADPLGFLAACRLAMKPHTKLFIQTSQADMFARGEFDTIYHEHISFFSVRSMQAVARRAGLVLEDVLVTPIHGGSYVFVLGSGEVRPSVAKRSAHEEAEGRHSAALYAQFASRAKEVVRGLSEVLARYRGTVPIVGFGAAAKGNTLLNFGNISLDYIVDENPLKQNLLTPGMNIPIYAPEMLASEPLDVVVVPLAWNFFDEIRAKVQSARPGRRDIFVTYFPEVQVH